MKIIRRNGHNQHHPHNPFDVMQHFFNDAMRSPFDSFAESRMGFMPQLDVAETDDEMVIDVDVSGYDPQNIEIELDGNVLSIAGKMESDKEEKEKTYYRRERGYGEFRREVNLPGYVDASKATCKAKNGVLTVSIPKTSSGDKKRIPIEES